MPRDTSVCLGEAFFGIYVSSVEKMMKDPILVVENHPGRGDCIVRLLRQFNVPFELVTSDGAELSLPKRVAGIILSGGPQSVTKIDSDDGTRLRAVLPLLDAAAEQNLPVLGICLGHQLLGTWAGGEVARLSAKVIGFQEISVQRQSIIFDGYNEQRILVFKYHEDHLHSLPRNCEVLAISESCNIEAFKIRDSLMWGVQFHPEVTHSDGEAILEGRPIPLHPWDPHADVKAPYIIKSFTELCIKGQEPMLDSLILG